MADADFMGTPGEAIEELIRFYSGVLAGLVEMMDRDGSIDGREYAASLRLGTGSDFAKLLGRQLGDEITRRLDRGGAPPLRPVD